MYWSFNMSKIIEIREKIDKLYPFESAPSLSIPFQYNHDIKEILSLMLDIIETELEEKKV